VVLLTDARRLLTPSDRQFLDWLAPLAAPRLVLLAKSDKLSRAERAQALSRTRASLAQAGVEAELMLFSSKDGEGVETARALLGAWLEK
jgi:GTP-binding protein EngB required for normal cell division